MGSPRTCEAPPREGRGVLGAPEAAAATPSPQRASVPVSLQHAAPPPLSYGIFSQSFVSSSFYFLSTFMFPYNAPSVGAASAGIGRHRDFQLRDCLVQTE